MVYCCAANKLQPNKNSKKVKIHTLLNSVKAGGFLAWCATATLCLAGESENSSPGDTNSTPRVEIVAPGQGAAFLPGTNISIYASSQNFTDALAAVVFYAGTNSLGVVTNFSASGIGSHDGYAALTWSNAPLGNFALTAVAVDLAGNTAVSASVNISVATNLPPEVKIIRPENGATYYAPATIGLSAVANDPDGTLVSVQFFQGAKSLGVVTTSTIVTNHDGRVQSTYNLAWNYVPAATYTLTAVATDASGDSSTSAPVTVTVLPPQPPSVKIVSPGNGAVFSTPAKIQICAVTKNFTNAIASVQFRAGAATLAVVNNPSWPTYFFWTNVPAGSYALTAVAVDSGGATATSAAVNITVSTNQVRRGHSGGH